MEVEKALRSGDRSRDADVPWHTLSIEEVEQRLQTSSRGLDEGKAARRLEEYGPNEIEPEREDPWWSLLWHQFRDPLIYVLLLAAAATLALRDYTDTGVILAVVVLNAAIGFVQELRARQAMRALARLGAPRAEVIREGESRDIESRDLVPGDVVELTSGTRVPADLRLVSGRGLEADESMLTGESVPVGKAEDEIADEAAVAGDQTSIAFAGTSISRGRGRGIVVRTGADTELGRIAVSIREATETRTPLQDKLERFGRQIGFVVLGLAILVLMAGLVRGMPAAEILITAVAVAVSAIPEGLPVILTVTLAIGVRRMARRMAIIRSLPAVETLGSTTVIGSDKTGTLTTNEMTVRAIWTPGREFEVTGAGYSADGDIESEGARIEAGNDRALDLTLRTGVLANEADPATLQEDRISGDPTEIALHVVASKGGRSAEETRAEYEEIDVLPFEPERRFMATLNRGPEERAIYLKGAPEAVLDLCDQMLAGDDEQPLDRERVEEAADELAARGLRVLATAYRAAGDERKIDEESVGRFVFTGLVGMEDPVRPEAVAAVADARAAGIRVLMLTGDHLETARAIGEQLGLANDDDAALSGEEIHNLSDEELDERLGGTNVYARVAPEHKLRIVERLKKLGEIVAVTGDGVNDAPALRAAHLGIAMGKSGTDVAREASDMVLADDNFATITAAVQEGRVVFSNVRKVTFFLLSTAVGEVAAILVALVAGWPLPYLAAQILWINLVTNGLQDVALAFEPGEPDILRQRPRPPGEGVLERRLLQRLGGVGAVLTGGTLAMFWWTLRATGDLEEARTVAMTQMVVFQFFHVFNCRSLDRSIFSIPLLSNRFLFLSLIAATAAHVSVLHVPPLQQIFRTVPLGIEQWLAITAVGTTVIAGGELDKWINRRRRQPLG